MSTTPTEQAIEKLCRRIRTASAIDSPNADIPAMTDKLAALCGTDEALWSLADRILEA